MTRLGDYLDRKITEAQTCTECGCNAETWKDNCACTRADCECSGVMTDDNPDWEFEAAHYRPGASDQERDAEAERWVHDNRHGTRHLPFTEGVALGAVALVRDQWREDRHTARQAVAAWKAQSRNDLNNLVGPWRERWDRFFKWLWSFGWPDGYRMPPTAVEQHTARVEAALARQRAAKTEAETKPRQAEPAPDPAPESAPPRYRVDPGEPVTDLDELESTPAASTTAPRPPQEVIDAARDWLRELYFQDVDPEDFDDHDYITDDEVLRAADRAYDGGLAQLAFDAGLGPNPATSNGNNGPATGQPAHGPIAGASPDASEAWRSANQHKPPAFPPVKPIQVTRPSTTLNVKELLWQPPTP